VGAWLCRPFGFSCPFSSHHASRFREPPYDPGRSDFPSPVLTLAFPPTAFPWVRRLKRWPVSTPPSHGLHVGLGPSLMARLPRPRVRDRPRPARCPEVLCLVKALPFPGWRQAPPQRALPLLQRSYDLMRQTKTLPPPPVVPWSAGLCRLLPAPAGKWPFPTLSLRIFPWALGPLPRWSPWCTCSFLPMELRPPLR
jgi:hypothetical protein